MHFPFISSFYQHLLFLLPLTSEKFNYDNPENWAVDFPQCAGYQQSPVSIYTHKTIPISLPPLVFGFYDLYLNDVLNLKNNGHTITFDIPETVLGEKPYISGGLLDDIYEAEEGHFHWGSWTQKGSEHMLNGRRYDLEMHIVHKNTKYTNLVHARQFQNGIAVLAVLFKVVKSPNVFYPGLNDIYNTLDHLSAYNTTRSTTHPVALESLLGSINRDDFFTYRGSLTTPPCAESVTWQVFPEVIPISYLELPKFWNINEQTGRPLLNNFRPLQSLENRKVYHRTPTTTTRSLPLPLSPLTVPLPLAPSHFISQHLL